jgi:hypothetical protein
LGKSYGSFWKIMRIILKNRADHFRKSCGSFWKIMRIILENHADHFAKTFGGFWRRCGAPAVLLCPGDWFALPRTLFPGPPDQGACAPRGGARGFCCFCAKKRKKGERLLTG